MSRGRGGSRAELSVAGPGSGRFLVGQAASCGAALPETLDGPSLDSSSTGHRALTHRNRGGSGENDKHIYIYVRTQTECRRASRKILFIKGAEEVEETMEKNFLHR